MMEISQGSGMRVTMKFIDEEEAQGEEKEMEGGGERVPGGIVHLETDLESHVEKIISRALIF